MHIMEQTQLAKRREAFALQGSRHWKQNQAFVHVAPEAPSKL